MQVLVAGGGLVAITGVYVLAMHLTVGASKLGPRQSADQRDLLYLYLHLGVLFAAACLGFGLGKWLNGLGVAYATLFVIVVAITMVLAQLGSQALACEGYNDILRHWACGAEG